MCKINKSLSPYPSRYPSPSQHVVIQVYKLPCDRCDGCDSLFSFYMRIAYYPRDCTNSITMLLKELQGCKVNSAIILLVGARFARPKIVYVAYYSQDRDRWFGQASPTTVKLRKNIYRKAYPNASPSSSNGYLPDCNSSSLAYLEGSPLSFLYKIINRLSLPSCLLYLPSRVPYPCISHDNSY